MILYLVQCESLCRILMFPPLTGCDDEDEVEPINNEMASYLASEPSGIGYGTNSLLEQWRKTYGNADFDYDP
ncbi:hypothetical protein Tco_0975995 [Tanacetum coccineum]|uniref:Uncharacterized protein n=1 Tax=Tanacetum coccineum TaxID=301880 RepID=A0ABQ5EGA8_9ASTR